VASLLELARNNNWSFVAWKSPDTSCIHLLLSEEEENFEDFDLEYPKSGFCIVPFDLEDAKPLFFNRDYYLNSQNEKLVLPHKAKFAQNIEQLLGTMPPRAFEEASVSTQVIAPADDAFKANVQKAVAEILKGTFKKVVISRTQEHLIQKLDLANVFMKLCNQSNAFVTLLYSPSVGVQIGASPEILVKSNGTHFKTVALAGTQQYVEGRDLNAASWTQKEIEEQALVSRYIIECFKKIRLREYEDIGPKTVRAGSLLHLKTEFTVDMNALAFPQLPSVMLKLLHPTSAICGMPLEAAKQFIKAHENHQREYFSGFLGAINIQDETQIYVNIRCAKIMEDRIRFYAGAGITEDSDPDKEYQETENKIQVLKRYFFPE
jgi:isochorismate synthase